MRLLKKLMLVLVALLVIFVSHILISTGFFRSIKPHFEGTVLEKVALKGAEDIMISSIDSFAIISSTERFINDDSQIDHGELFLIDLTDDFSIPVLLTADFTKPFAPHGISFIKTDSTYRVMAINHTPQGHSIEVFDLFEKKLIHIKTLEDDSMIQPNDLVMLDESRFYFTNDHRYTKGLGKLLEEYLGLAVSNVVYFDGESYVEAAKGIAYANGINYDQNRALLFVASPRDFLVKVYSTSENGSLTFIEDIPCGTGVDNIDIDLEGNLWIGAHPSLLRFDAYSKGYKATAPSEIIKISYRGEKDYDIEEIYLEKGNEMSGSTVAVSFGNKIFVGNVMDDKLLILSRNQSKN